MNFYYKTALLSLHANMHAFCELRHDSIKLHRSNDGNFNTLQFTLK